MRIAGLLLEANESGAVARAGWRGRTVGCACRRRAFSPSQTAIQVALKQQSAVITEDLAQAEMNLQEAQSIVAQGLRAIVSDSAVFGDACEFGRIAGQHDAAGSFLELCIWIRGGRRRFRGWTGRFWTHWRRMRQVRWTMRDSWSANANGSGWKPKSISHAIFNKRFCRGDFKDYPHLDVSGCNFPCLSVGGDYFDVFPMGDGRTAFLIADVSGKGLGAALLTTMLQGRFPD